MLRLHLFDVQVPVGVIPKNEVVREQLVQIMEELQKKYTPMHGIHIYTRMYILAACVCYVRISVLIDIF